MKRLVLCLLISMSATWAVSQDWQTRYEKSGFLETPRYDETVQYCKKLAAGSPWVHYSSFGTSPQGRELPLLTVDRDGLTDPDAIRAKGRVVMLIQACIHAGEPDGKDAGLVLVRDLVIAKKYPELLNHVSLLFIPILNVDGHERFGPYNRINQNGPKEMGWRTTAQNLNMNRDFLKADAPETRAWLKLFNRWLPEFFIDCHVTDGADYQYPLTYGLEVYGNMEANLTAWNKDVYLPEVTNAMLRAGYPITPYVMFRKWSDPRSGLYAGPSPAMLSQGYTALRNRPGLLIETHMLKDYKTRVSATYEMLRQTMAVLENEYTRLRDLEKAADEACSRPDFRNEDLTVHFETSKTDSTMIDFLGIRYDTLNSTLTGNTWFRYGHTPVTLRLPFFNKVTPKVKVHLPEAYLIPPEWTDVIALLDVHGIRYLRLAADTKVRAGIFRLSHPKWAEKSYEGRHTCSFDSEESVQEELFPKGTVVVDMNQPACRVAANLLEPKAPGSLLSWGFFDIIFEQKEYSEPYVMEAMALEMIRKDPGLKAELDRKKAEDPAFAKDPNAILNWFYSQTPYWDQKLNVYPVGRILDRKELEGIVK